MQKNSYSYDELIDCGKGKLFGEGNAKLPLPPMLMFDRITEINENSGEFKKGVANGRGTFADKSGNKYTGFWKDGKLMQQK